MFEELTIQTNIVKEAPYLIFNHKMYLSGSKMKVCTANVKTILKDKEKIIYDIPEDFPIQIIK
jgi:hypothetical protein